MGEPMTEAEAMARQLHAELGTTDWSELEDIQQNAAIRMCARLIDALDERRDLDARKR